jgi:hypothetical protein
MSINFVPNDPAAGARAPAMRVQRTRRARPVGRAGFTFDTGHREGRFDQGTPEFVFWQCREAALAAVETWEAIAGPLTAWHGRRKRLHILHDDGDDLNAYYDRESVAFFHRAVDGRTVYSGSSTDVVAHEVGHGLLDALRPDLWDAAFLEAGAFHEAFGDCMAMLTALDDAETRTSLLAATKTLKARNFVESTAESLALAIRALRPTHNAAEPRHAFNAFEYQIPETLPANGGPGALIDEVHSFGMLFTGCFYDLVASIFASGRTQTEASLLAAARAAGALLVKGAATAVVTPRFLQSVGRAMVLADDAGGGGHRQRIRDAFEGHGIRFGPDALLAPSAVLDGAAPGPRRNAVLGKDTQRDLARRLGVPATTGWSIGSIDVSGRRLTQAVHTRRVPLDTLDRRLRNVTMAAPVPVLIGESGGRATVMGQIPEPISTEREVHAFVASLLEHDQLRFAAVRRAAAPTILQPAGRDTHEVVGSGRVKRLVRTRFRCCGRAHGTR